jgi:hypothetical protein
LPLTPRSHNPRLLPYAKGVALELKPNPEIRESSSSL